MFESPSLLLLQSKSFTHLLPCYRYLNLLLTSSLVIVISIFCSPPPLLSLSQSFAHLVSSLKILGDNDCPHFAKQWMEGCHQHCVILAKFVVGLHIFFSGIIFSCIIFDCSFFLLNLLFACVLEQKIINIQESCQVKIIAHGQTCNLTAKCIFTSGFKS